MPALVNSGTQTATINTEHTLDTLTTAKTYGLWLDTANMVIGDMLEIRFKTKALSGGAQGLYKLFPFQHAQAEPQKQFEPIPIDIELVITLKQTAGTGRAFPWKIFSYD